MVKRADHHEKVDDFSGGGVVGGVLRKEVKFKGVRRRKWGRWVSEIRLPNSRERIWLGSYNEPEKAARAYDAAVFILRGRNATFNFPATVSEIPAVSGKIKTVDIQSIAARYADYKVGDAVHNLLPCDPSTSSVTENEVTGLDIDQMLSDSGDDQYSGPRMLLSQFDNECVPLPFTPRGLSRLLDIEGEAAYYQLLPNFLWSFS